MLIRLGALRSSVSPALPAQDVNLEAVPPDNDK
jgi:hypothetical protein